MIGKTGLESYYDGILRGTKGVEYHAVDALGRTAQVEEERPPVPGQDIHLTIDIELQELAEKLLKGAIHSPNGGAVVVLDPQSGRIKALASAPNFDPRPFARGITTKEYSALMQDPSVPPLSRAFETSFSPGSTFKLVTSSAGLAEKICTPDTVFYCGGSYQGHNCFVTSGHGSIGFVQSLAQSCDVVYYRMADQLGIDRLRRYCKAYGLGSPTGIELPHEDGGLSGLEKEVGTRRVVFGRQHQYGGGTGFPAGHPPADGRCDRGRGQWCGIAHESEWRSQMEGPSQTCAALAGRSRLASSRARGYAAVSYTHLTLPTSDLV